MTIEQRIQELGSKPGFACRVSRPTCDEVASGNNISDISRRKSDKCTSDKTTKLLGELVQPESGRVIFPGSFNPLHRGHQRMALVARQRLDRPVDFEISMTNVDKNPLLPDEVLRRVNQIHEQTKQTDPRPAGPADSYIWITRAPTFVEKARLFLSATFLVGADTIRRIANVRYYERDEADAVDASTSPVDSAIRRLEACGTTFLVFGRLEQSESREERQEETAFQTLDALRLPDSLLKLCESVSEEEFREDVASRDLR